MSVERISPASRTNIQGGVTMTTFDQQFIDMMVPHHLSAVEMAKIAAVRGEHPEIEALAAEIISAQETEIAQMREWRKDWFGTRKDPKDPDPLQSPRLPRSESRRWIGWPHVFHRASHVSTSGVRSGHV
jgi:uncharacterized protein (DUF305 family)